MSTRLFVRAALLLALIPVLNTTAFAQSPQATLVGTVNNPDTGQFYYSIYTYPDGGIRLYDGTNTMVLVISGVAESGDYVTFTAYYHMGQEDQIFWVRKYAGTIAITDVVLGTATITMNYEYIGDYADPILNPVSTPVIFLPAS